MSKMRSRFTRCFYFGAVFLIMLGGSSGLVSALTQDDINSILTGTSYYDPSGGVACTTGTTPQSLSSTANIIWPFASKSTSQYNRVDQGWDIQAEASAKVYAIAAGTIHKLAPDDHGFGNDYPTEELDTSIGGPSNWVYYGHVHMLPSVLDKHVQAGELIAIANSGDGSNDGGQSQNGSAAPVGWLEIGFAQPNTDAPVQKAAESVATQAGQAMKDILINVSSGTAQATNLASPQLDLTATAKKYGIDTAIVKQVGGSVVGAYNADQPPDSPASVLKLIIADVFLQTKPDLSKSVAITKDENYFSPGNGSGALDQPKTGQKITLSDALTQTLEKSSDTDANILIDAAGGLSKTTELAHQRGYKSTDIKAYYSNSATSVLNQTTVTDLTKAMENIFTESGAGYKQAQDALSSPDRNTFGLADADANKWGGVPGVSTHKPATGNSALYTIGSSRYIITMYTNQPYVSNDSPSVSNIRQATTDIAASLRGASLQAGSGAAGGGNCSSSCSVISGDSIYKFLQALSFKESGGNPTINNSAGAKGKYQYMDGTWQSNAKSYYGPALQYATASAAPEEVQDAVAFIEYSVKSVELNGDMFKMAVSHYLPAALSDSTLLDIVPQGNTETPRQYAQNFISDMNAGKGSNITLKFADAPDFQTWYTKSVGHQYTADSSSSTTTCSGVAAGNFVFYDQYDNKWASHSYGSSTIADSGCGPTSVAMVVATLADSSVTPLQTADFGTGNGAYIPGAGSDHQKMLIDGPEHWGLKVTPLGTDLDKAAQAIKNGGLVIAAGAGKHPFSTGGHILVLRGLDGSGNFLIGNPAPNLQDSQDQAFSASDLVGAGLQALYEVTK
jgi:hypothetical protein